MEECFGRELVGKFCRAAQIAEPQRRGDFFAIAAANRAVEYGLASTLAEISMGYVLCDAALELRLQSNAEFAGDPLKLRDLAVGEARGPIAEPGADDAVLPGRVEGH